MGNFKLSKFLFLKPKLSEVGSGGSGSKIFDLGWAKFLLLKSVPDSHLWFGFEIEKILFKIPNFSIFFPALGQKNLIWSGQKVHGSKPAQPLIYCESKVCSGEVRSHL